MWKTEAPDALRDAMLTLEELMDAVAARSDAPRTSFDARPENLYVPTDRLAAVEDRVQTQTPGFGLVFDDTGTRGTRSPAAA